MKMTSSKFIGTLSIFISLFAVPISYSSSSTDYKVHFRVLSFSMACNMETPNIQKKYLPRASGALVGISQSECVDTKKEIMKVKPAGIGVKYDSTFDKFEVVIHLDNSDARALMEITKKIPSRGYPERMLIGVDGSIVAGGYLNEPFVGDDYYISAESHETAHNFARLFVTKITKDP